MSEDEARDRPPKPRARREKRRREAPEVATASLSSERNSPEPVPISDREAVLGANAVFYRAIEQQDRAAMGECWAKVPHARCIHPGWEPLCGWEEIVGSWGQIFRNLQNLRFELVDLTVRVGGHLAWVDLCENLEATHEGKPARSQVVTTNLFERQPDGRWRMIHHHSSPVMVRQPSPKRGGEPLH